MIDDRQPQLEMRWVPVSDEAGRVRMEAVWIVPAAAGVVSHAA